MSIIGKAWDWAKGIVTPGHAPKSAQYTPNRNDFQYGLGPSDSYASQQAGKYDQRQAQLAALGADAYNRQAPTQEAPAPIDFTSSGGQGYLAGADAASRAAQLQALGGIQNQTSAINAFANRAQGPSAAQAQLQAGTDMAARQQYGMARTQPGGGGAALRTAAFNAAGISGNAANTAAQLRAQEDQAYRAQQLQALGAAQQGAGMSAGYAGQMRGQDQGLAQAQAGQANYDAGAQNQFNQGQQQLQYQVGQNNLNAGLQTRQQNDAMTLGAINAEQQYDPLRNQLAAGQSAASQNFSQAQMGGAQLASQNYAADQANKMAYLKMYLGMLTGGAGAAGQSGGGSGGGGGGGASAGGGSVATGGAGGSPASDIRAKRDIVPVRVSQAIADAHDTNARFSGPDTSLSEFGGLPSRVGLGQTGDERQARLRALQGYPSPQQPDYAALDEAYRREGGSPNLRGAQGYEYAYRDPDRHGEGRYVGPMAQDLEHLPGVVEQSPDGTKTINAPRLTLANTAAVSELQKKMDRLQQLQALGAGQSPNETTQLSPEEDARFQQWVKRNNIRDLDHPDSHYDYRGFWRQYGSQPHQQGTHFTDEFKQHGHPTFSIESNYSKGIGDGGAWSYDRDPNGTYMPSALPQVAPIDTTALDDAYRRSQRPY